MRLLVLSDLHVEFLADEGRALLGSLDPSDADVLVVAGDLCTGAMLARVVPRLCSRFARVIFVAGNHEYYGSDREAVEGTLADLASRHRGFHWLHETEVEIEGARFGGTTLWFRDRGPTDPLRPALNDFRQIDGLDLWLGEANARAVRWLEARAASLDVVVTHHVPAGRSLGPWLSLSPLRRYLVCDLERLVTGEGPRLWVHGHSHRSCDHVLGRTRVVCNPAGYRTENPRFDRRKVVSLAVGGHASAIDARVGAHDDARRG